MFRGRELPRLLTMLVMLGVLFMLITRAGDPNTWRWLTNEPATENAGTGGESGQTFETENQTAPAPAWLTQSGPSDEDPDEADAAREEFQAITDRTTELQIEEMPAYKRLLKWVEYQPLSVLQKRSRKDVFFTDLMQSPDKYRGQLVHLDLHLRKIRRYSIEENPARVNEVFEAWGFSNESGVWLYEIVFAHAPPSLPLDLDATKLVNIEENVSFDGYFLKLQGYHEAGAKPRDPPLAAPLLIGQIVWHPVRQTPQGNSEWLWSAGLLGGLFVMFIIARWTLSYVSRRSQAQTALAERSGASVEKWLEKVQRDEAVPNDEPSANNGDEDGADFESGFDPDRERHG